MKTLHHTWLATIACPPLHLILKKSPVNLCHYTLGFALSQKAGKEEELSKKEYNDVFAHVERCGSYDLMAEPLPFSFSEHPPDLAVPVQSISAPYSLHGTPKIHDSVDVINIADVYVPSSDYAGRELAVCFSPHGGSLGGGQQNPCVSLCSEQLTPLYKPEGRFTPSSSKRILFSPL